MSTREQLAEVTTEEELDVLPVGSVVLSETYLHSTARCALSFQRGADGHWYRAGRLGSTHPDYFLPATVLYSPEVAE